MTLAGVYIGLASFGLMHWALAAGYDEAEVRTAVLLLMVLFENVHVFNCRSETRSLLRVPLTRNRFVVLAVLAALALHIVATNSPGFSDVLHVGPLPLELAMIVVPVAFGLALVMEVYKFAAQFLRR